MVYYIYGHGRGAGRQDEGEGKDGTGYNIDIIGQGEKYRDIPPTKPVNLPGILPTRFFRYIGRYTIIGDRTPILLLPPRVCLPRSPGFAFLDYHLTTERASFRPSTNRTRLSLVPTLTLT